MGAKTAPKRTALRSTRLKKNVVFSSKIDFEASKFFFAPGGADSPTPSEKEAMEARAQADLEAEQAQMAQQLSVSPRVRGNLSAGQSGRLQSGPSGRLNAGASFSLR